MSELPAGAIFAGHRIEAVVGRGGMGVVYRATQLDLDRTVALKLVAPELLQDETARMRFLQETRLAASIDHPHVIPIHYAGEEDGVPYLAMRYVVGDDGRTLVRREGPLPPERAARIVSQIADALDAAHSAGLVHRDVKPANVLLAAGDHAYLSDFGLSRHVASISGATRTGQWVGTLDYVAPEQIRGAAVDARADVYALGCLLFFLLTGTVPFPREGDEAKLWAHLTQPPPRPSETAAHVPAAFDRVIQRALAKSPDDRYPSAGDLGRAAVAAAAGKAVSEPERAVARGSAAATGTATRPSPRPRRRRWPAIAAAGIVAAATAVGVLLLATGDDEPSDTAGARPTATPTQPPATAPRVTARIRTGARPNALAVVGDRLWVGAFHDDYLTVIDRAKGRAVSGMRPTVGQGTADLAVADDTVWVGDRHDRLLRLDRNARATAPPIPLPATVVALTVHGDDVWAALEPDAATHLPSIVRIDRRTGTVEATLTVGHVMSGIVYARGSLWTMHGAPNFIMRRDPVTLAPRHRINVPGGVSGPLVYARRVFWATAPDQDQVIRYDPRTGRRASVSVGSRPIGLAVKGRRVWVAANGSSTLYQVSARTLRIVGEPVRVPLNPLALLVSGDAIWVSCVGEDVVVRLEAKAPAG